MWSILLTFVVDLVVIVSVAVIEVVNSALVCVVVVVGIEVDAVVGSVVPNFNLRQCMNCCYSSSNKN